MPDLTIRQQTLKEAFIAKRGYWAGFWEDLLRLDDRFFEAYLGLSSIPWTHGPLSLMDKELILVAADSATTHLYEPGLRVHVQNALRLGATARDVISVLEVVSTMGIHSFAVGLPILLDELGTPAVAEFTPRQVELRATFVARCGRWSPDLETLLLNDTDYFEKFLELESLPLEHGPLSRKLIELIRVGVNAATTHLYARELPDNIKLALNAGATVEEVIEVLELVSLIGLHSLTLGVPLLAQAMALDGDRQQGG